MTMLSNSTTRNLDRELPLDELDGVAGGFPISYEDGILAIGIRGVAGIFIGAGCIGGWIGGTGVAVCG